MAKIKVGVAGVGVMGDHHTRIYSILNESSLVGVYDYNFARAQEVAAKYSCQAFENLADLLNNVSALTVASPTSTHHQVSLECLKFGKHLLVEKPLAGVLSEARDIVNSAKAYNCILAEGMIERFNPAFLKLSSLCRNEKILGMELKRFSPYPARISDASVVFDIMFHDLDLLLSLSRIKISSIKASGKKVRSDRLDEAQATIFFSDGLVAKLSASRVFDSKLRQVIVTTDKSIFEADLLNKKLFRRAFENVIDKVEIGLKQEDQLTLELKDFLHAIAQGREPRVPGSEALLPIEIAEEVERLACL